MHFYLRPLGLVKSQIRRRDLIAHVLCIAGVTAWPSLKVLGNSHMPEEYNESLNKILPQVLMHKYRPYTKRL